MSMLRMAMYAPGVSLYCAPTADDRETWLSTVRYIAMEGRCFVLSALPIYAPARLSGPLSARRLSVNEHAQAEVRVNQPTAIYAPERE
jgi:hypothetical protein